MTYDEIAERLRDALDHWPEPTWLEDALDWERDPDELAEDRAAQHDDILAAGVWS